MANLTSLIDLDLGDNQVSDVSPVASLTSLALLDLANNQISDISPLVANPGISYGDKVYLWNNPLTFTSTNTHIPELRLRGVIVYWP